MNTTQTSGRWLVRSGWAGIVGPVLFFVTWMAQELFLTEGFSPLGRPVSALAAWPHGWVQNVNFVVFGVLTIWFAVGLHRGLAPSRFGIAGPVLFAVSGVGSLWAAVFPLRLDAAGELVAGLHPVGGAMFFLGTALALVVISFRLARDPRYARLAVPVRLAGILLIVTAPMMSIYFGRPGAPLADWVAWHSGSSCSGSSSPPASRCRTSWCALAGAAWCRAVDSAPLSPGVDLVEAETSPPSPPAPSHPSDHQAQGHQPRAWAAGPRTWRDGALLGPASAPRFRYAPTVGRDPQENFTSRSLPGNKK